MRSSYGPFFGDPTLKAEVPNRLHPGEWVVDEEQTVWTGGMADC